MIAQTLEKMVEIQLLYNNLRRICFQIDTTIHLLSNLVIDDFFKLFAPKFTKLIICL